MRRVLALVVVLVVVPGLAACQRPGPGRGEARLILGDGDDVAGAFRHGSMVRQGEVVEALRGEPQLELSGRHRRLTLRRGTQVRVAGDDDVELLRGDLLSEGTTTIDAGVAGVDGRGVVRVTRTLASSVRVYEGRADVSSAGRSLRVRPRTGASVPAPGLVSVEPKWVSLDRDDSWDVRYLGDVIDLTEDLETGGRSFTEAVRRKPALDVSGLINGIPDDAWVDALSRYTPGEALIGSVIAAVAGDPLPSVFALRAEGAAWGIVAIERAGGDSSRAARLLWDELGRWAGRTGVSGVGGRRGVALDVPVGAGSTSTEVLGGSSSTGGSGRGPDSGSGSGGSGATTTTTPVPTVPVTLPPVTVPPVTVPPLTGPPTTVPTITVSTTLPPVPELP